MTALGTDIAGIDDIDPMLSLADGRLAAAQAVMTTLLHGPGRLWWAPEVGYDIRQHLHASFDAEAIQRAVESQCTADERVDTAVCTVTVEGPLTAQTMTLATDLVLTNAETAELTLSVNQVGDVINTGVL